MSDPNSAMGSDWSYPDESLTVAMLDPVVLATFARVRVVQFPVVRSPVLTSIAAVG